VAGGAGTGIGGGAVDGLLARGNGGNGGGGRGAGLPGTAGGFGAPSRSPGPPDWIATA
jgi:hypothetical protein